MSKSLSLKITFLELLRAARPARSGGSLHISPIWSALPPSLQLATFPWSLDQQTCTPSSTGPTFPCSLGNTAPPLPPTPTPHLPLQPTPFLRAFLHYLFIFMLAQTLRIEHVRQGLSPRPDMDSLSTAAPQLQVCSPSRRFCLFPRWNFLPRYPLGAGLLSVIVIKARAPRRQNSASSLLSPVTTGLMNPLIKHD